MYFMIDNYDSFVYNLSAYLRENGAEVLVRRADQCSLSEIDSLNPEGIIISPGPRRPQDAVESLEILKAFQGKYPILGVCLGHQVIAHHFGALVHKGTRPMHGKISSIFHKNEGLFHNLPGKYNVTRYHSLVVDEKTLPEELFVTSRSDDGAVMGIAHRTLPIFGIQFHPEAVQTEFGHELLRNFQKICERWNRAHAYNQTIS